MTAIQAHPPQGLDGLTSVYLPDPGRYAIHVRVHATSLNFHDLGVVTGRLPAADRRIPMADGAGVVEAIGSEVTVFKPGDHIVSTFFPTWLDGEATLADFATTPGETGSTALPGSRGSAGHVLHACAGRLEPRRRGVDAVHGHPVIGRSFPLAEIVDDFRFQKSGGHFGKIVVEF